MRWPRRIFNFYLDASIHAALAVICLLYCTGLLLNILVDRHLAFFLFFGSISCYNFIKYGVEAEKYIRLANPYHKSIQVFSFMCLAIAFYHFYFLNIETWLGIAVLMVLTGFYALPVLPGSKNLRSLGVLKVLLVAVVWAGISVLLPVVAVKESPSWDIFIETTQRFLMVFVLLVPFEIRDLRYDAKELGTLPQRFGVMNTKRIGMLAILLFLLLIFFRDVVIQFELLGKSIMAFMLATALLMTHKDQNRYFASFWVEAIPIGWYVSLLVLNGRV
ncbi:hypothetical protein FK220_002945 [Flavobacteriaceae bacterium TP-CH-4]|uniref:Prenyltransferase n=1 Tax=Pelagihabitans pacificus TaxID=2696054 RepID=A0A967AQE9_9FLAO|nr:hypothetical protein [Pelagihabitans pacificus]NHF58284.1 hypothetical protein [Pelagihabitans pacificus]